MAMPRKLTLETIDRICQAYAAGVKATAIASQLRLSPSVVFRAIANPAEERRLAQATIERGDAVALFRQALADPTLAWLTAKQAYQFRYMAQHVSELRGKTLLCYCSLDHPCHVDVICEFANQ